MTNWQRFASDTLAYMNGRTTAEEYSDAQGLWPRAFCVDDLLELEMFNALRCYNCGHRWDEVGSDQSWIDGDIREWCEGGVRIPIYTGEIDDDGEPEMWDYERVCPCTEFV